MCPRLFPSCVIFPRLTPWIVQSFLLVQWYARCQRTNNRIGGQSGGRIVAAAVASPGRQKKMAPNVRGHLTEPGVCGVCQLRRLAGGQGLLTGRNAAGRRCDWKSRRSPSGSCRSRPSGGRTARRRGRERRKRSWTRKSLSGDSQSCCLISKGSLCIPDASVHALVCIAAFVLPHCGIAGEAAQDRAP